MERIKTLDQPKIAVIAGHHGRHPVRLHHVLSEATLRSARLDLTENKLFTLVAGNPGRAVRRSTNR
jgi:hypothetical protein